MDEQKLQQIYLNKLEIKRLEAENKDLINEMGLPQAETGTYTEGRYIVEVSPNLRFNADTATELFPIGENGENFNLYEAKVSATLAKQHLSAADYERCQKQYPNNKVEVKII
jgi:hypothetical protein